MPPNTNNNANYQQWDQLSMYFRNMLSSTTTIADTAELMIENITDAVDPSNRKFRLWKMFFTAVISSHTSHKLCVELLQAIQTHPPTTTKGRLVRTVANGQLHWHKLPCLRLHWQDVYTAVHLERDRVENSDTITVTDIPYDFPSEIDCNSYMRFIKFSVKALHKGVGHIDPFRVFLACQEVLERKGPVVSEPSPGRLSPEEVWLNDLNATCMWVDYNAEILFRIDPQLLRSKHESLLDLKEGLWPREDGLTRDRWKFWAHRFRQVSHREIITKSPSAVLKEKVAIIRAAARTSAKTIEGLLVRYPASRADSLV